MPDVLSVVNTLTLAHNDGCARKGNGRLPCNCGRSKKAEYLVAHGWRVEYTEEVCES